ncbi:MAG: inosine-5-monophosphate dehydrogenase [Hadesarchaea archaeon]|nr:MAG: inosine-5-monophosphate dehydrogenase [Hadesarchaea archaeon]HDI12787.1 CBS domain-containing protein [Hadesarchaea archaeon]
MKRTVPVKDAMTRKVLTAGPNTTVARAAKLMADRGVGSIIIVKGKKPIGILTERDLLMKVVSTDLKPSKIRVGKIMSKPVVSIRPDADITEAARLMAKSRIRRLPVVERGDLVGVITTSDITAISPELMEVLSRPEVLAKDEIEESVCEACGEVTTNLYEVNGMWVCENCRDTMGG